MESDLPCGSGNVSVQFNVSGNSSYRGELPYYLPCAAEANSSEYDYYYDWSDYFINVYLPKAKSWVFPSAHEWVLICAYFFVFLLALVGNILVCYAVLRNQQMRTVTNYYIFNLSVADILVSLICLPVTVVFDTSETWFFGDVACKVIPYFQVVSMCVSVFTLCAIAIDRYFAICQPLMFKSTAKRAITVICTIWVTSFMVPIPQIVVYRTQPAELAPMFVYLTKCYEVDWFGTIAQKVYHVVLVMIVYVIPLVLVTVAYLLVCRQLWARIPGSYEAADAKGSAPNGSASSKATESQLRSRRKVAKMLIVVVIIFAVCYLPLHVLNILRQFPVFENVSDDSRKLFHIPFLVAHWLAFANSAVNPIIYNFLSAKFRKEFQAAFRCCICCASARRRKRRRMHRYQSSLNSSTVSNSRTYTENVHLSTIKTSNSLYNSQSQFQ